MISYIFHQWFCVVVGVDTAAHRGWVAHNAKLLSISVPAHAVRNGASLSALNSFLHLNIVEKFIFFLI